MDEKLFLNRIRSALAHTRAAPAISLTHADRETTSLVPTTKNRESLIERFTQQATLAAMEVHRCPTADAPTVLADLLRVTLSRGEDILPSPSSVPRESTRSTPAAVPAILLPPPDPDVPFDLESVVQTIPAKPIHLDPPPPDFLDICFTADAAISFAHAGIAETGSVVLCSAPRHSRLASVAAPLHLSLLPTSRLVPDLLDLFTPDLAPPPLMTLVTGPSKTADIEMTLIRPMHGPARELVLLLD